MDTRELFVGDLVMAQDKRHACPDYKAGDLIQITKAQSLKYFAKARNLRTSESFDFDPVDGSYCEMMRSYAENEFIERMEKRLAESRPDAR